MAKVNRDTKVTSVGGEVDYSVMVNIVVTGSKQMPAGQQDTHVENEPEAVKISVVDATDPTNVLGEAVVGMASFKPDKQGKASVGFSWNVRGARFHIVE